MPILEQRLGGPDLNRGIRREALRGNLEQARRVSGAAQLLVELGLRNETRQEQSRNILGIAAADPDAAGVGVHQLAAELAGFEDGEDRHDAETGGREQDPPPCGCAPLERERQQLEPADRDPEIPRPLPPQLVRMHGPGDARDRLHRHVRVFTRLRGD